MQKEAFVSGQLAAATLIVGLLPRPTTTYNRHLELQKSRIHEHTGIEGAETRLQYGVFRKCKIQNHVKVRGHQHCEAMGVQEFQNLMDSAKGGVMLVSMGSIVASSRMPMNIKNAFVSSFRAFPNASRERVYCSLTP
uniref:Uncharacterized protein n=1 Tax=Parascaris equorum TaxID=6256 RepID=A0A914SFS4_PAREQ